MLEGGKLWNGTEQAQGREIVSAVGGELLAVVRRSKEVGAEENLKE